MMAPDTVLKVAGISKRFGGLQALSDVGIRIERGLGSRDGMRALAEQLRQRFPNSPEWARYQRGAFDE